MPHPPGSIDDEADLLPLAKALQVYRLERRTMDPEQLAQWNRTADEQDDTVRRQATRRGLAALQKMAAMFRACIERCDGRIAFLKEVGDGADDLTEETERRADAVTELEWLDEMIAETEMMQ